MRTGKFTREEVEQDQQLSKLVKSRHYSFPNGSNYYKFELNTGSYADFSIRDGILWEGKIIERREYAPPYSLNTSPVFHRPVVASVRAGRRYRLTLEVTSRGPGSDFGAHFYNRDDKDYTLSIEEISLPQWMAETPLSVSKT